MYYLSQSSRIATALNLLSCKKATRAASFVFLLAFAFPFMSAQAQVGLSNAHPTFARGSQNKSQESYDWDSVNTFNGNLNFFVPLGIKYPLARSFGYQFGLYYNSNVWDVDQSGSTVAATPVKHSNAGFGWDLSFGRLIPPTTNGTQAGRWVYVSPDGAHHPFYPTLHPNEVENDPGEATYYTRDSTYYRMKLVNSSTTTVESADGTIITFNFIQGQWRLANTADRFGNFFSVDYSTQFVWRITDSHSRVQTVYFRADPAGTYDYLIDRIELAAFAGTKASFSFEYVTASVPRPTVDDDLSTSAAVNLPLLKRILLPDGSSYNLTYHADTAGDAAGRLASAQLPTLGKMEWSYGDYSYVSPGTSTALPPMFRRNTGVTARRMIDATGNVIGTWAYSPSLNPSVPTGAGNVALASKGATATASSTVNANFPASAAINGDRKANNWANGGGWGDGSQGYYSVDWIRINFNASKPVSQINVFTLRDEWKTKTDPPTLAETFNTADNTGQGIVDFDVQYLDGHGWINVPGGTVRGNNRVWRQFQFNTPINTTAIRVVVHKSVVWTSIPNNYSRIVEVEAFSNRINVARPFNGGSVAASSEVNANYPASAVIDGDRAGRNWENKGGWNDATENNFGSDWLRVDFAGAKTITEIDLYTLRDGYDTKTGDPGLDETFRTGPNTGNGITDFEVQYLSGSRWLTIPGGSVTGNDRVRRQFLFSPITTSAIRVVVRNAATWTSIPNNYSRIVELEAYAQGGEDREFANTVKTPLGDKTIYYFNVNTVSATGPWHKSGYGVPGNLSFFDGSGTRVLAKAVYDCDQSGNNCQLMRSEYVRYEQDSEPDPASAEVGVSTNRREASVRTVYHDDVENGVARFADIDRSEFDGLGHYRRSVTNGNFGSGDVRNVFVNFDLATGNYPSTGYASPAPTAAWVPNIFNYVSGAEGSNSMSADICYDRNTGAPKRVRLRQTTAPGGAPSSKDVVIVYGYDSLGQLTEERYFGGDIQAVSTGALCGLVLPSSDQYQVRHTYQHGVRSASHNLTADGQVFGPSSLDKDVDQNTGLIATSRDTSGISTRYEYDSSGRLKWEKPMAGHGTWIRYEYTVATGNSLAGGAKKFTYKHPNGVSTTYMTYSAEVADSFGKLSWEQNWIPTATGAVFPNRYKIYNALGWITHESDFSVDSPKYKEYLNYDPFGRPRTIRPPEGAHHDTAFEYKGDRSVKKTVMAGTYYNQSTGTVIEEPRSSTIVYDRQGRTWKEIIHGLPDVVTTNTYDAGGRVVQVMRDNKLIGSSYSYDGRGFLTQEFTPDESLGDESMFYENIDAKGKALQTRRYNHLWQRTVYLAYQFDRASRLTKVLDRDNPSKIWKEFTYADSNGANDWRAGKLWKTKRLNDLSRFLTSFGVTSAFVSETYVYGGVGGRVSQYEMELSDALGRNEKFVQTTSYNDLGDIAELGYPNGVAGISIGKDRKLTYNYSQGLVTSVSGVLNQQTETWVNSIAYHPNGLIHQIAHSNGVTDFIAGDPLNYPRAASVTTTGARNRQNNLPDNLNTGDFQYDGAGRVVRAGSKYFVPPQGTVPPTKPTAPPYQGGVCADGWEDPTGMVYAVGDKDCNARVFYYYTAGDELFKVEDGIQGLKTWHLRDSSQRLLRKYATTHSHYQPWPGLWEYTLDYIFAGSSTFATEESRRDTQTTTRTHYHKGQGASGMSTDGSGFRNN